MKRKFQIVLCFALGLIAESGFAQMPYLDTAWVSESPLVGTGDYYHTSSLIVAGKLTVTGRVLNGSGDTDIITTRYNTDGSVLWSNTYGGSAGEDDYGIELKAAQDGHVYVVGAVKNTTTGYDYCLIKYNYNTGAQVWVRNWDGAGGGMDIPSNLIIEGTTGIYITGGSEATNGLSDFATVKISNLNSIVWEKYYDYSLHDAATNLVFSGTDVVVSGASAASVGSWDIATVKYDRTTGTPTDTSRTAITGATMVEANAMIADSSNNIYITGYALNGADKDLQLIKLDSSLNLLWTVGHDDGQDDVGRDVAVDLSGNVFVTGYSELPSGKKRALLLKFEDDGDTLLTEYFGDTLIGQGAVGEKIVLDADENVLITGTKADYDSIQYMFFNKYDNQGVLLLSTDYSSYGIDDQAFDIDVDADSVYITGLSSSSGGSVMSVVKYVMLEDVSLKYFYLNSQKIYFSQQPRMYAFSLTDSSQMSSLVDGTIVTAVEYTMDGNHYVFFGESATETQMDSIISLIEADTYFDKEYMVACMTTNNTHHYSDQLYFGLDNFVEVVFDDPDIDLVDVENFGDDYSMTLFHAPPSVISGGVYIFQVPRNSNPSLTMDLAAEIWENDSDIVDRVNPSMRIMRSHNPYDPLYSGQWWAENDGEGMCNGEAWVTDSDIDLDKAWNLDNEFGYGVSWSGLGVTVGVIDYDGYEYDHEDLTNVYQTGYYLPSGSVTSGIPFTMTTITSTTTSHGQSVSGLIAANLGDSVGIAGTAYNSKIVPCLMMSGTSAAIISGIQLLCDTAKHVSVINMSFGFAGSSITYPDFLSLGTACKNAYEQGRPDPDNFAVKRGMVLIASSGKSHVLSTTIQYNYPAAYDAWVLSVGATTPDDKRKTLGDAYEPSWASPYYPGLDVCAPGICMYTTDFQDTLGYDPSNYNIFAGTSAAAPLASGVAALILEKNASLTAEEVYNNMRWGCEKVGGYPYTLGGAPQGKCDELGYGRLNAFNSLGWTTFLTLPTEQVGIDFYFNNPANNLLQLTVNGVENYSIRIVDITGAICYESSVNGQQYTEIPLDNISHGLYFVTIVDLSNNIASTSKLVIQ